MSGRAAAYLAASLAAAGGALPARAWDLDPDLLTPPPPPPPIGTAAAGDGLAEAAESLDAPPRPAPPARWRGPSVALGWARYALADGFFTGDVDELFLEGVARFARPVRLAFTLGWGLRDYQLGTDDFLGRTSVALGGELVGPLGPVVPYAAVVGTLGLVVSKRFTVTQVDALGGGGLELGADVRLGSPLALGVSVAYLRLRVADGGHDVWQLRLRLGL